MKKSFIVFPVIALFFLIASNTFAQKVYTVEEAKNHMNESVIIKGEVTQVSITRAGQVYFNMGGKYPQSKFSAVILKDNVSKFDNVKQYEGKIVEVKGKVKEYNSKPEILLDSKEQIKIVPKEEEKK